MKVVVITKPGSMTQWETCLTVVPTRDVVVILLGKEQKGSEMYVTDIRDSVANHSD